MITSKTEREQNLELLFRAWQVHFIVQHVHLSKAERKGKTPEQLFQLRLALAQQQRPDLFENREEVK